MCLKSDLEFQGAPKQGLIESVMEYFSGTSEEGIDNVVKLASVLNTCITAAFECLKVHRLVEVWRGWLFKVVHGEAEETSTIPSTI